MVALNWDRFKRAQYHYVTQKRQPCDDSAEGRPLYPNQCALRLSRALKDAGWPFDGPQQPYTATRFGPRCSHGYARGARSLADYLETYLTKPTIYRVPPHPKTGEVTEVSAGHYLEAPDGTAKFFKALDWMLHRSATQSLRGIIFFDQPEHIDGFDMVNKINVKDTQYGIIGEQYGDSSKQIRVFYL